MLIREIPLAETGMFPRIVNDYLSAGESLREYYTHLPQLDAFGNVIHAKSFDADSRRLLVEVLTEQYQEAGINPGKVVSAQIQRLADPGTFTVTTGHQLCLFTGPLYFIYKILTTIRLAEELQARHPSQYIVPVFWLASEDHDFAEVNHVHLFGQTFTWELDTQQQPVGKVPTASLGALFSEVKKLFGNSERLPALLRLLEESYLGSPNLSVATRKMVHALFADYGLVMIEPDDARLKRALQPVMERDILNQESFAAIDETNRRLGKQYKLQVNGREINFFYLSEAGRRLIKRSGEQYVIADTDRTFSTEEMQAEISAHPERFSPNVVLRPVYQELILPNLAYIGGPGEIAYWLQLKDVFGRYGVPFPVIWPRNSFMLLTRELVQRMEKSKMDLVDYFLPADKLNKKITDEAIGFDLNEQLAILDESFQTIINELLKLDNQLSSKVVHHKTETAAFFSRLKKEVNQQARQKSARDLTRVMEIKEILFPGGTPQERYDNYLQYQTGEDFRQLIRLIHDELHLNSQSMAVIQV